MIQGPPGTGKTTSAANILIPILSIFGLDADCYASSNAATELLAGKISKELKNILVLWRRQGIVWCTTI